MKQKLTSDRYPIKSREAREHWIANDQCPECGGELDTGWECNDCGFDAMPEAKQLPPKDESA
jgi:Zn ribbon nucleic-acid-binding protein